MVHYSLTFPGHTIHSNWVSVKDHLKGKGMRREHQLKQGALHVQTIYALHIVVYLIFAVVKALPGLHEGRELLIPYDFVVFVHLGPGEGRNVLDVNLAPGDGRNVLDVNLGPGDGRNVLDVNLGLGDGRNVLDVHLGPGDGRDDRNKFGLQMEVDL